MLPSQERGIRIIVYLDDFLILLPQWLGFTINWDKSSLEPTQSLTFLCLSIDSLAMSLSLPEKKLPKLKEKCQKVLSNPKSPAREVASLLSTLEATRHAIWQAPLHYRHMHTQLIKTLHASGQNYDTILSLNSSTQIEMHWWLTNIEKVNSNPINLPPPDMLITSDASKAGWGTHSQGLDANRRWSLQESK